MDKDYGIAIIKDNGNSIKVTTNLFRGNQYLHIREYIFDGDNGNWYPSKTGITMPLHEVTSLIELLMVAEIDAAILNKPIKQMELKLDDN